MVFKVFYQKICKKFINRRVILEAMAQLDLKKHTNYFFMAFFIGIVILSLILVKPFYTAILGAIIITYIFYPIYRRLNRVIRNKNVCSLILTFFIMIIIILPLLFAANAVLNESVKFYQGVRTIEVGEQFSAKFSEYFGENIDLDMYLREVLNKVSVAVMQTAENAIFSVPQKILFFFITFFIIYYLFKEGKGIVERIKKELPMKETHRQSLSKRFNDIIYATVYGIIITAIIQGIIGAIGLWIFKVPSPILLGLIMIILAMLPFVGAWLIWFPAAIVKLVSGDIGNGIGLLLFGLIIVSTIDNILRPKIIGSRAKIHPVLILLGVLGGLYMFGLVGIIIGPLILAVLVVFLELYLTERNKFS